MSRPMINMYLVLSMLLMVTSAQAVEIAPRISDREIVESLSEVRQQQKYLGQQIQQNNAQIQQTKTDLERQIQQSHDSLNQRIDDMMMNFNQRFDSMINLLIALFSTVMALIMGLVGYMIWDRRTAQKPLREKMERMEERTMGIDEHLAMGHPSGSIIQRMLAALRELAKTDEKVADILRTFSLL